MEWKCLGASVESEGKTGGGITAAWNSQCYHTMTAREKKIVQWGAVGVALYLLLFFGFRSSKGTRADYERFVNDEQSLEQEFQRLETKRLQLEKLNETFKIDPAKFSNTTVVSDVSSAIQNAAAGGGVMIGPIRESSARASAREITSIQIEAAAPVPAIMKFLHQVNTLGFPLLIDSLQINPDNTRPGNIKLNLTVVVLDYEQWRKT